MVLGFRISTNALHYGNERGFKAISITAEIGPHMLGLYRWPIERGQRAAYWTLNLVKTWTDEKTRKTEQRKLALYPVQEG